MEKVESVESHFQNSTDFPRTKQCKVKHYQLLIRKWKSGKNKTSQNQNQFLEKYYCTFSRLLIFLLIEHNK